MQITLEAVEKVMELTGVDYPTAKDALVKADGDVDEAVVACCRCLFEKRRLFDVGEKNFILSGLLSVPMFYHAEPFFESVIVFEIIV